MTEDIVHAIAAELAAREDIVHAIASELVARGTPLEGEVGLLAVNPPLAAAVIENAGQVHVGIARVPGATKVLTVPADQAAALAVLVAQAYERVQRPDLRAEAEEVGEDELVTLARVPIGADEELRVVMLLPEAAEKAMLIVWRIAAAERWKHFDEPDLLCVPLLLAAELCNLIRLGIANLGGGAPAGTGSAAVH